MKKVLILFLLFGAFQFGAKAQTFKIGAVFGIPTADAETASDFVLGIDGYYYFGNVDSFLNLGGTVGFRNFFGKKVNLGELGTVELDDAQFLPVAAAGRVKILGFLSGGVDAGYAFGLTDGLDGGFYFKPVVGFLDIFNFIEVNIAYETILDDATWGNVNVGVLLQF